jgi:hypothetical protein
MSWIRIAALMVVFGGLAHAQFPTDAPYVGRRCRPDAQFGHFPMDVQSRVWPRSVGSGDAVGITYALRAPNYVCTTDGELLLNASVNVDIATGAVLWVTLHLAHMGADWVDIHRVLIETGTDEIVRTVRGVRSHTVEGLAIDHVNVELSAATFLSLANASSLRVTLMGQLEIEIDLPRQARVTMHVLAEHVRERHGLAW